MTKLPHEFANRMQTLLGEKYTDYLNTFNQPAVKGFRVNTEKISLEAFEKINPFGNKKIPYVENGFYLEAPKVGNHPFHHAGMIYVQEPAAMAPVECVEIDPDWICLDMCAAPGGKSTQVKNKLSEKGLLVSNEIISSRCKILTGNIERLGFENCVTTCMPPQKVAKTFPETFDFIVVDAPCSGEGVFRKEEIALTEWSNENVLMCAERQQEILEQAVKALKQGGTILYATCTFSLEENEMTVDTFLQNHPDFEILPVKESVKLATADGIKFDGCQAENINECRRFYPHLSDGEGQFMAVLHHKGEHITQKSQKPQPKEKVEKIVFEFLDDCLLEYKKENVTMYNGNAVYFTPDFAVPKGVAFSCGVTIGEVRKNYIQPHHQFFMALGKNFRRKIELSSDSLELQKYLHGEEITVDCKNGWAVVTVSGCSVGGVKVVNGKAKNHYPKGLRTL
jgi:NOL1/NOP2/sun family putative RNA methylase